MKPPRWISELFDEVAATCVDEIKGRMSGFSWQWSKPQDNACGTWLLQIAPASMEITGGNDDGAIVFDFMDVDLMALPNCLDEVQSFTHDPDYGREPHLALIGRKGRRDVVVEIYLQPLPDDEPTTVLDVNCGTWGENPS
jgi:hypothetical protein